MFQALTRRPWRDCFIILDGEVKCWFSNQSNSPGCTSWDFEPIRLTSMSCAVKYEIGYGVNVHCTFKLGLKPLSRNIPTVFQTVFAESEKCVLCNMR